MFQFELLTRGDWFKIAISMLVLSALLLGVLFWIADVNNVGGVLS